MPTIPLSEWLLPGQAMTAGEFLGRWSRMPDLKHAELIEGIVYMPSPVTVAHGAADSLLGFWLNGYAAAVAGLRVLANTTFVLSDRSVCQPDQALCLASDLGGRSHVVDRLLHGAPELVVEIAYSSADRDLGIKKAIYQRAGVDEYLVVDLLAAEIHWFHRGGPDAEAAFEPVSLDPAGILRSQRFPGLWLDPQALWRLDLPELARVGDLGRQSTEFFAFQQSLAAART